MATTVKTEIQLSDITPENRFSAEGRRLSNVTPSDSGMAADSEPLPPKLLNSALLMATLSCVSCMWIQARFRKRGLAPLYKIITDRSHSAY